MLDHDRGGEDCSARCDASATRHRSDGATVPNDTYHRTWDMHEGHDGSE